jgi:hypothetical protein
VEDLPMEKKFKKEGKIKITKKDNKNKKAWNFK